MMDLQESNFSQSVSEQAPSGTTEVILFCILYSLVSIFRGCECISDEKKHHSGASLLCQVPHAEHHTGFSRSCFKFPSEVV